MTSPAGPTRTASGPRAHSTPGRTGNGQWALGYREPLNANEQVKKDDDPLNVRARIENIYAHRGFQSIDPADLRGRMRWFGLYTQRKPGIDGGRTAVLEPHELDDEYFMLRVRIDGGALTTAAAAGHRRHLRGVRAGLGRPDRPAEHPAALDPDRGRAGDLAGARGRRAGHDRGLRRLPAGHPRQPGRRHRRRRDHRPARARSRRSSRAGSASPEFSNLPRKFKTAISGRGGNDVVHELNDISFVGVEHPELGPGFDLWVGGGLSTNPRLAERLGVFVAAEEVPDVWAGVVSVFRDFGYRRLRHRARLKFLVADWGVEKFREVLEKDYLGRALPGRPGARAVGRPRRRRRCARAEGRPVLRRRRADRRPRLRRPAAADRRRRRGPRLAAGSAPRRTRSCSSSTSRPTRSSR